MHSLLNFDTVSDFDLYLLRPGTHDIVLNPSRAIADYGVSKNVSFVHKHGACSTVLHACILWYV